MGFLNNTKRTRFKVTIGFGCILALLSGYAIYKGMDGAAVSAITGFGGIAAVYKWGETKRKSDV